MQEYIKKSLETPSGFEAECWSVIGIWIDLKANCAVITLEGYKDIESKKIGKNSLDKKDINISNLETLSIFSDMHNTVVAMILNHSDFQGASYEQVED